jgi:LysR family transcriptional regulator for bpeEF and oprC
MLDLNDLRVFERVADLRSFSAAARALGLPKSTVSRSVARLEDALAARLLQRTTREVQLTAAGEVLRGKCAEMLGRVSEAVELVSGLAGKPHGTLKISSGVGFGVNVLAEQLPGFLLRHPEVDITLDLKSEIADLVSEGIDAAIRLGPMPDSSLVRVLLGSMQRHLCASPKYLKRRPAPRSLAAIAEHDAIEMPGSDGRPKSWTFVRGKESAKVEPRARICVNEALTIHRLVVKGVGLGIISGYVCAADIKSGRLVRILPDWSPPPVEVSVVFPTKKELSPNVRAFVDFMKEVTSPGVFWQQDPAAAAD